MCLDPVSIAAITAATTGTAAVGTTAAVAGTAAASAGSLGTILSIGSGILGAYTAYTGGMAQSKALKQTAAAQELAAQQAIEQGNDESDRRRRAGALLAGEQKAALAANGIDVGGELSIDLLSDTQALVSEDAFSIRENSRRGAQGMYEQAANSKAAAGNAKREGIFGAVSTALGTAAKVGPKFASWSNTRSDPWRGLRTTY